MSKLDMLNEDYDLFSWSQSGKTKNSQYEEDTFNNTPKEEKDKAFLDFKEEPKGSKEINYENDYPEDTGVSPKDKLKEKIKKEVNKNDVDTKFNTEEQMKGEKPKKNDKKDEYEEIMNDEEPTGNGKTEKMNYKGSKIKVSDLINLDFKL